MINRDLEKRRNSFFNDALQTCGRDWIRLDQTENNFTYNVVAVALKTTTSRIFTIFQGVISIFQIFSRSGKLLGKYEVFFKDSKLCTNPAKWLDMQKKSPQRVEYSSVTIWRYITKTCYQRNKSFTLFHWAQLRASKLVAGICNLNGFGLRSDGNGWIFDGLKLNSRI